jgi:4-azaleucine resistance transporter AzlC
MLEKYKDAGRLKKYLIFGMCDETFSILCTTDAPEDVDNNWFRFFVTLLNHSYWVGGSILGSVLGSMISFSTNGLEFVLTALFVVIFSGTVEKPKGS